MVLPLVLGLVLSPSVQLFTCQCLTSALTNRLSTVLDHFIQKTVLQVITDLLYTSKRSASMKRIFSICIFAGLTELLGKILPEICILSIVYIILDDTLHVADGEVSDLPLHVAVISAPKQNKASHSAREIVSFSTTNKVELPLVSCNI